MSEILRLTSQAQPLAVGVPLYPFSRKSLYDPTFQPSVTEAIEASTSGTPGRISSLIHGAPLPNPTSFDSENSGSIGSHNTNSNNSHKDILDLGSLASLGLSGAFGPSMVSAQGIWHPADETSSGSNGINHNDPMDIFGQLGF
jgi:hypothetical protein